MTGPSSSTSSCPWRRKRKISSKEIAVQMIEQRFSLFCVFTQESAFLSNVRPFFGSLGLSMGILWGGPRGIERRTFWGGPAIGDDLSCAKLEGGGGSKREIFWGLHTKQNLPPSPCRGCDQPDIEGGDEKCAHHGRSDDIRSLRGETVYYHCTVCTRQRNAQMGRNVIYAPSLPRHNSIGQTEWNPPGKFPISGKERGT